MKDGLDWQEVNTKDAKKSERQESELQEQHERLAARGWVAEHGRFEILAITAGEGNGWFFPERALQASLPLWEGVGCFVDHGGWMDWTRSVRDLGGVCRNPRWDSGSLGIVLDLETLGPSGPLVEELGREMLELRAEEGAGSRREEVPDVGFSADVVFTARGDEVQEILRVLDLSLVFNPARGGAFVRALNQQLADSVASLRTFAEPTSKQSNTEVLTMEEKHEMRESNETRQASTTSTASSGGGTSTSALHGSPLVEQLQNDVAAVRQFLAVQDERQKLAEEAEAARAVRQEMCKYLLESGLAASRLPAPMQEHVRAQFDGKVYEPAELTQAIDQARKLVSDLAGAGTVVGPRVAQMYSTEDQLQAAVDELLGAERPSRTAQGAGVQAARLSGIRELYLTLTGDVDLHGGYNPQRIQLATTANFAGLVKNALNKVVVQQWDALGAAGYDWWMRVTAQEHFENLNTVTGTLVGTVGTLPVVAEGAEYTELKVGDSPETATFYKYGGYIPLTLELIDRDETRKLAAYPRELARAGIRKVSALVAAVFTANSGIGPTLADTGALFNNTAVTTAGGHANLLTTALSASEWEVVSNAVYSQPMLIANESGYYGTGPAMALDPKYCLVPRELRLTAMKILYPLWENSANIYSENLQHGELGDVVVVPEWTDATDWAAVVDPRLMPGIVVCERFGLLPEVFIAGDELSPAVFMNDEHRIKVRHFLAVLVQDYRPLHKSNVAG